jgi:hypothetical protein
MVIEPPAMMYSNPKIFPASRARSQETGKAFYVTVMVAER